MSKLTNTDLVGIIESHRRDSLGVEDGELSNSRATAMDHYHGRPYGNEMEGRSAVVSRDLSETVDWAMPAIILLCIVVTLFFYSRNPAMLAPLNDREQRLFLALMRKIAQGAATPAPAPGRKAGRP